MLEKKLYKVHCGNCQGMEILMDKMHEELEEFKRLYESEKDNFDLLSRHTIKTMDFYVKKKSGKM